MRRLMEYAFALSRAWLKSRALPEWIQIVYALTKFVGKDSSDEANGYL